MAPSATVPFIEMLSKSGTRLRGVEALNGTWCRIEAFSGHVRLADAFETVLNDGPDPD